MSSLKKKIVICLTVICLLCASAGAFGAAKVSASTLDAADRCFLAAVSGELGGVSYTRKPLYDLSLTQNGWQYDFTADGAEGYALLSLVDACGEKVYEAEEIKLSASSPFDACAGIPVYIAHNRYFDMRGDALYDLTTGQTVTADDAAAYGVRGFGYGYSPVYTSVTQTTAAYSRKAVTEEYSIQYDLPSYLGLLGSTNCACTAGATAIGYYDRFCTNLIPNFTPYTKIGTKFKYKGNTPEVDALIAALGVDMGTDQSGAGTTFAGFQDGMKKYVNRQGYSYSTQDAFSWFSFDFNKFKSSVQAGKPVCLFLPRYAVLKTIATVGGKDVISSTYSEYAHVVTACGYRVDTYYNAAGSVIDTRTYLKINVGLDFGTSTIGYLNINDLTTINHAISVTIS